MKKFEFYQDVKVTVWQRQHFSIEAECIEDARDMVKQYADKDISCCDEVEADEIEWLCDTEEHITPEENGGCATIEVYEYESKYKGKLIADNAPKEDEERKFKAGEHVAICDDKGNSYLAIVMYETWTNSGSDTVAVRLDEEGVPMLETDIVEARFIYQQSRGEVCPKCGKPLYDEHNLELDYSYYCFHCDENFYNIEVQ